MKAKMMRLANELCSLLDRCCDDDFVDDVIERVANNFPFDEDEISAAEDER